MGLFGFLKKDTAPVGPFEFSHKIEIDRPAAEVYRLLDWADALNAKRQLGNSVEPIGDSRNRFLMVLDLLPDLEFEMTVDNETTGRSYGFQTVITPPVGKLSACREAYQIEPLGDGSCLLKQEVAVYFVGGLSTKALAREVMVMGVSNENGLYKLKVLAEQGVDAVHAIEAQQFAA